MHRRPEKQYRSVLNHNAYFHALSLLHSLVRVEGDPTALEHAAAAAKATAVVGAAVSADAAMLVMNGTQHQACPPRTEVMLVLSWLLQLHPMSYR
jgi:shikimate 5-dehydrogenase